MRFLIKKTPDTFLKTVNDEISSILNRNFGNLYPEYGFANHKGYPTAAHFEVLQKLPLLSCYRMTYGPIRKLLAQGKSIIKTM